MTEIINVVLIIFIILCAVASVNVRELVSAAFILGAFSFFLSILWSVLAAPDVSFTEATVGVGASTIFIFLALFRSKHFCAPERNTTKPILPALVILGLAGLFAWASLDLPSLGDTASAASQYLSPYYLKHAYEHSHTPNTVTAVVVDYRSFDTLIEAAVIFTAGVACLFIVRSKL